METITIRVVAYQDGDLWVAQGLEFDISARSPTLAGLPKAFRRAVTSNFCVNSELGREGLNGIAPAPTRFWTTFEEATIEVAPRNVESRPLVDMRVAA